jgi:hypothetical protein
MVDEKSQLQEQMKLIVKLHSLEILLPVVIVVVI